SFHARGDAAFVWHGLTGDVAEMSRDVLALLLSFDPPREKEQDPPPGLSRDQAQEYTGILRARRFLVQTSGQQRPDELSPLHAAAESTMPYPEIPDVRLYAVGGAPPQPKLEEEPTFASLFATPHPSLGGRTYAQAMAHELRRRGAFDGVPAPHQVLSLGLAMELPDARVATNIARVQQAESYRAVILDEIGAQLGFSDG